MEATTPTRPRRPWPRRLGLALAGLVVGLGVAECGFRIRDDGGFPKLNVYVADPALGVRLQPGATQRFVYPDNPVTTVRINRSGYRGADLPAPGADEVVVVGDSQVFGLGVEEHQTFAALLAKELGRTVVNGGVPTYGPDEYAAVARELIAARRPKTVVFTVNLVNDLFEASRPNATRHVVVDGWAVRKEAAPSVTRFPGRTWLARNSHLFYALRQVWHRSENQSVASEGTWRDLVASGERSAQQRADDRAQRASHATEVRATEAKLVEATRELDEAMVRLLGDELTEDDQLAIEASHKQPGDSVQAFIPGAEETRSVLVTAAHMRRGAILRAKLRARFEKLVNARRGAERTDLLAALADQPKLAAKLDELSIARLRSALESPLAPVVRALHETCSAEGVRLVVLVLPIDVAVSPDEWKKYEAEPLDMSSVASLTDELTALGADLGVSVLDATAALRAAEPGAFLDHDIHMTPKGHAAVAVALAATLAAPAPAPRAIDAALSAMPLPAQWAAAPEIVVAGSTAARCETKLVREWLRVLCLPGSSYDVDGAPKSIAVTTDRSRGAYTMVMPRSAALTVALRPGDSVSADFAWKIGARRLDVTWPDDAAAPRAAFTVTAPEKAVYQGGRSVFTSEPARAVCACWGAVYDRGDPKDQYPECHGIYGALDDGCAGYGADCAQMVACVLRDPSSPPR